MFKLIIWGTGNLAKLFIKNNYNGEIVGFIETNKSKDEYMGKPIYSANEITSDIYDYIIVANSYAAEIFNVCLDLGIELSKVIFLYGVKNRMGCTDESVLKEILQEKNYTNYCSEFRLFDDSFIKEDAEKYSVLNKRKNFEIHRDNMWPMIGEKYAYAGSVSNYFWQDLWAAKHILKSKGNMNHFDIGSRLDGFISHLLAAGMDVTMIDIRKFPTKIEGLHTIVDDATSLRQIADESIESMSALCSLEHFGLGRYGDPIDPEACFKCFENIQKKLKKGGRLYISLPVGKERVEYNAHRIFYASTVIDSFSSLKLLEYSCTTQEGIEYNVDIHKYDKDNHNGEYRYGLFSFEK
jgi:hypothetical protein